MIEPQKTIEFKANEFNVGDLVVGDGGAIYRLVESDGHIAARVVQAGELEPGRVYTAHFQ